MHPWFFNEEDYNEYHHPPLDDSVSERYAGEQIPWWDGMGPDEIKAAVYSRKIGRVRRKRSKRWDKAKAAVKARQRAERKAQGLPEKEDDGIPF